jgi:transposase
VIIQLLLTRQYHRLTGVLDVDEHIAVKVAYVIYQKIIAAHRPTRRPDLGGSLLTRRWS